MARSGPGPVTSCPLTVTLPVSLGTKPEIALMKLVFPQPDGPTRTTNSPAFTSRLISCSAVNFLRSLWSSYEMVKSFATIIGSSRMLNLSPIKNDA